MKQKILIVYKKSRYEIYSARDPNVLQRYLEENNLSLNDLKEAHENHYATLGEVKKLLGKADTIYRAKLNKDIIKRYSLVITVGGDGTVLDASHFIDDRPLFAINSDYREDETVGSVGFFCGATRFDLEEKIDALLSGKMKKTKLNRLQIEIDNRKLEELVLNDILVHDECPAASTRYFIEIDGYRERHRTTSGIWIATAAGSTGAIASAGGKILPIRSKKFQYVVREVPLNLRSKLKLQSGIITKTLLIESQMRQGMVYIDGRHVRYPFRMGSVLEVYSSDKPLILLGFDERKRTKYMLDSRTKKF